MIIVFFMLTLGIDDAGRGPLIGPMILAGVLLDKNGETFLKKYSVKDSKMLEHPTRVKLSKIINESALTHHVVKSYPEEIDEAVDGGMNLNTLEAMKCAEIINAINSGKYKKEKIKVIVDCPSVNIAAWRNKLLEFVDSGENLQVVCEHKADANHLSVSAASIVAKVVREEEVALLKKKYGDIGSGYPSDPYTKKFLVEHGNSLRDSGIFRKSWATWKEVFSDKKQKTLEGF